MLYTLSSILYVYTLYSIHRRKKRPMEVSWRLKNIDFTKEAYFSHIVLENEDFQHHLNLLFTKWKVTPFLRNNFFSPKSFFPQTTKSAWQKLKLLTPQRWLSFFMLIEFHVLLLLSLKNWPILGLKISQKWLRNWLRNSAKK